MKQTATEWLFQQLWETPIDKLTWYAILKQATAMEKQQIIDARVNGVIRGIDICDFPTKESLHEEHLKYYNETFKAE